MKVRKENQPAPERLQELGVDGWSPWSKEKSTFDWSYADTETGYIKEGSVTVHLPGEQSIEATEGDLIQFPAGLECTWEITADLSKVFTFDPVELRPDEEVAVGE